jgi:hypothetical protein
VARRAAGRARREGTTLAGATTGRPPEPGREGAGGAVEAILRLKHAYLRLLDTKRFEELGELLTEDATAAYADGRHTYRGRGEIVDFLRRVLGDPARVTMHTGHHPEIDLEGEDEATGTWYLEDRVIVHAADWELHGTAVYRDRYRRQAGRWRIAHTAYERIFEEQRRRSTGEVLSFVTMFESAGEDRD